jgi:hypothetical protein
LVYFWLENILKEEEREGREGEIEREDMIEWANRWY